jgi:hypothetical protein
MAIAARLLNAVVNCSAPAASNPPTPAAASICSMNSAAPVTVCSACFNLSVVEITPIGLLAKMHLFQKLFFIECHSDHRAEELMRELE